MLAQIADLVIPVYCTRLIHHKRSNMRAAGRLVGISEGEAHDRACALL